MKVIHSPFFMICQFHDLDQKAEYETFDQIWFIRFAIFQKDYHNILSYLLFELG